MDQGASQSGELMIDNAPGDPVAAVNVAANSQVTRTVEGAMKKGNSERHLASNKSPSKSRTSARQSKLEPSSESDQSSSSSESSDQDSDHEDMQTLSESESALESGLEAAAKKRKKAMVRSKIRDLQKQLRVLDSELDEGEEADKGEEAEQQTPSSKVQTAKLSALMKMQRQDGLDAVQMQLQSLLTQVNTLKQAQAQEGEDGLNHPHAAYSQALLGLELANQAAKRVPRNTVFEKHPGGAGNALNPDQRFGAEQFEEQRRKVTGKEKKSKKKEGGEEEEEEEKKKEKRASTVAYKRVDQLWDANIHDYKLTETMSDHSSDQWDQYIFTVRRRFDWEHKYQETLVDIKSKPLKQCLQHIMAEVKGLSFIQDTPNIDPNMLFLYLEETREFHKRCLEKSRDAKYSKKEQKAAAKKAQHLRVLIKYLDKDYAETKRTLRPLVENGQISFDLLWALFKPNLVVYTTTYGDQDQPRAFKVNVATKHHHFMKGTWYEIEGKYLEYDGKSFGMGSMSVQIASFQGVRRIASLECFPIQFHPEAEQVKSDLIERGKKFVALQGVHYKYHKGMAFTKRKRQILKINIDGRIMCDTAIHRRINPNYQVSTVKPKELDIDGMGRPGDDEDEDDDGESGGDSCSEDAAHGYGYTPSSSEDTPPFRRVFRLVKCLEGRSQIVEEAEAEGTKGGGGGGGGRKGGMDRREKDSGQTFSEEELLIASPVVLGFAFNEKLWLEFTVSGISDIKFNEDAFDSLVLPEDQKSIVKALVSSHAFHPSKSIDDIISGKGRGLCCVLHGPPGTGKTLTAEGIADLLKCPLYMVSAGDLGTEPRTLEKQLQNTLDIAHSWGAILLLDEADVFLEKRSIHDVHRNALVSIFLRLLEYFQGILFLTTNRVETFDEAFVSRIHLSLRYEELSAKARHRVWKLFMDKTTATEAIEVEPLTESDYKDLARRDVNGRQIKNLVRAAQALAVHQGRALSMAHIRRVIDVAETFERDLKGGTGYAEAMNSYT